jgi:hypothetical protein
VIESRADGQSAWVTSRLEFFKHPSWMKQFPFAHTIDMTHRIRDGVLEVDTRIDNLSVEPMPVAIGFIRSSSSRILRGIEWTLSVAARTHWPVSEAKMPTGVPQPIEKFFANPAAVQLAPIELDDVFSDLVRGPNGEATMSVRGRTQRLDVVLGANYRAVVIYAPKPAAGQDAAARNFVCIEPVTAIINGLNLAHKGFYKDLQSIAPGGSWRSVSSSSERFLADVTQPCPRAVPLASCRCLAGPDTARDHVRRHRAAATWEWPSYNGQLNANRHSPLDQINTGNVATLEQAWTHEIGGERALQMTPLVIDGVMYVAAVNEVRALDARTGRQIWQFVRPQTPASCRREIRHQGSTGRSQCSAIVCFFRPITPTCLPSIGARELFSGTWKWRTLARTTAPPARCSSSTIS